MECPHLSRTGSRIRSSILVRKLAAAGPDFHCSACKSKKCPWMCVHCGLVSCGRFVEGHAKLHFEEKPQHSVCIDCSSYSVFCYSCDEFVINDTRSHDISQLRSKLQSMNEHENRKSRRSARQVTNSQAEVNGRNKKHKGKGGVQKKSCQANVSGLRNLGNTCFMNAVLQSLRFVPTPVNVDPDLPLETNSNIQQFSEYFKELPSLEKISPVIQGKTVTSTSSATKRENGDEEKTLLAEELRKTLLLLWSGSKGAICPESLFAVIWKVVPRYRGYQQQDAHEFLRYMLDRLHTELLSILPYPGKEQRSQQKRLFGLGKSTIVTGIFGGILQNEVTCLVCGNESRKHDPFLDLSLDLPDDCSARSTDSAGNSNDTTSSGLEKCHLLDCLSSFIRLEELEDTELYHCQNCKKKQKSTKRFWIRRLPNVLCLHLKRFRWNNYLRTKLDTFVEFPLRGLDMSHYVLSNKHETRGSACGGTQYDLAAAIVHHGSGLGSGHYTSYATHGGCWHHFNDSNVTVCEEETVATSNAYILFYIRRELNLSPFSFSI